MPGTTIATVPPSQAGSLAAYAGAGRENNFNLLRFTAASLVVLTHAFGLTGNGASEPLKRFAGLSMGSWAVDVFFAVSGFLIAKSWDRRRDPVAFFYARFMRIYPALWVSVCACVFIIGPLFTSLPAGAYFRSAGTWKFLLANSTVLPFGVLKTLPGVFASNPGTDVNSPLWTLPYELKMYIGLTAIGVVGGLRMRWLVLAGTAFAFVGFCAAWLSLVPASEHMTDMLRCEFSFFAGTSAYLFRDRIALSWTRYAVLFAGVLALLLAFEVPSSRRLVLGLFTPALVIPLAFLPRGWVRHFNRLGDYSYGIYIFGNPVQQGVLALTGVTSTAFNFLGSYTITLLLAVASWHLLERRATTLPMPRQLARIAARLRHLPFLQGHAGTRP